MLTFILVGSLGLVVLVLSTLLGEFLDLADGAISGTGLGAGLTVFGAVGLITYRGDGSLLWPVIWSAIAGLAIMIILQMSITRLKSSEDGVRTSVVGFEGVATTDINAARGEVSLDHPSELERRLAWSNTPISQGTRVVVKDHTGSRVRVEPVPGAASPDQEFAPPSQ